ncbi:MAG TPA: sigma-54-dependent Fis family transcriptional regulator [Planctomycetes bacterium]|nr:sigma-54-dependent Fis family transcriptional regulator [Planctomycetota bacterium]
MKVLIADDEQSIVATLEDDLADAGHDVLAAPDGNRALDIIRKEKVDCLITDLSMPGMGGMTLIEEARKLRPGLQIIVITGYGTIESAVEAIKKGAAEYVQKPFLNEQIVALVDRLAKISQLEEENEDLRTQLQEITAFENIVGASKAMQDVFRILKNVSRSESDILLIGETGTGKEVMARAIHAHSPRKNKPLVTLSCAAIPSTLLEDELFGHERGAYTDARDRKIGRFERAHHGTFFLDDIDDMPLETQVKLLRILQEREFERLGGEKTIQVDVRVIVATKIDLRTLVDEGRFREDLFFRLNVVPVRLPPLRERKGDIPLLAKHFISKYAGSRSYEIKPDVMAAMEAYYWPGNVRELEHAIERAIAFAGQGRILRKEHLVEASPVHKKAMAVPRNLTTLREAVEAAEKEHIEEILRITNGHKAQAAEILGISRKNLWEKMKNYGIEVS